MIRINLLPQARQRLRAAGPSGSTAVWLVAYVIGSALWCVGLAVVYFMYQGKLDEQLQKNAALDQRVEVLKKKSERLEEVQQALERSRQLEELVDELNRRRTGPTRVLRELSQVLSRDGGPTIDPEELTRMRRDNPLAGYNRSWDVRRLWLQTFDEEQRECRITGKGKTNEDVAEFLRRLALSDLFDEVTLQRTELVSDQKTAVAFIGFDMTCKVRY
jgi:type IV pilus assembly protein PilN